MRTTLVATIFALALVGCGDDTQHGGGVQDMSVSMPAGGDMATPTQCNPNDNMGDGQACSAGCPTGTMGVNVSGGCKCFTKCNTDPDCACDRLCDPITVNDAGAGGACLPGNTPGTRCGRDAQGNAFGSVFCGQLTLCVNSDQTFTTRYCNYKCTTQADCPFQTVCEQYTVNGQAAGNVCAYISGVNATKMLGDACDPHKDVCQAGQLCDGSNCRAQCDGPGATCAGGGTCTAVVDGTQTVGYVCK